MRGKYFFLIWIFLNKKAILVGTTSNEFNILHLYDKDNLIDGEFFVTSGDGSIFSHGFKVAKIIKKNNQKIRAVVLEDFYETSDCYVEIK